MFDQSHQFDLDQSYQCLSLIHRNCVCFICRTNQNGDPVRVCDINAPSDDLFEGPYFVLTDKSPAINLPLAVLFDLIICRTTKTRMSLLIPSAA